MERKHEKSLKRLYHAYGHFNTIIRHSSRSKGLLRRKQIHRRYNSDSAYRSSKDLRQIARNDDRSRGQMVGQDRWPHFANQRQLHRTGIPCRTGLQDLGRRQWCLRHSRTRLVCLQTRVRRVLFGHFWRTETTGPGCQIHRDRLLDWT